MPTTAPSAAPEDAPRISGDQRIAEQALKCGAGKRKRGSDQHSRDNARPAYLQDNAFDGGRNIRAMAKRLRRQHIDEIAKSNRIAPDGEGGEESAEQYADRDGEARHCGAANVHRAMVINPAPPVPDRSVHLLESH